MVNFFAKKLGIGLTTMDLYGKPKPKKFNYSSEANSLIIETAISDFAKVTESTSSAVIEDTLIEKFIPLNDRARYYVCGVLLGKKNIFGSTKWEKYGIREALSEIFESESAGTQWKSVHNGVGKEIVEYACRLISNHKDTFQESLFNKDYSRVRDCLNSWDSICGVMDIAAREESDFSSKFCLEEEARYAHQIKHAMSYSCDYRLFNALRFLIQNWEILGPWTHTWRFLSAVMDSINDWQDSPEERINFRKACDNIFSIWDSYDAEKEKQELKMQEDATLITYDMHNGAQIKAPRGWVVTNPEDAIKSNYAGVIEIRNGDKYDAPHFLFFLKEHPASELTEEERLKILRDATSKWPRLSEVQDDIVELQYGSDGGILNQKEYIQSPCIGFFPIADEGQYPFGNPPYGAVVIRGGAERKSEN